MKRRAIIGLSLAIGVCACATQMTPIAGPANMAWAFNQNPDEGAKLAFGAPASDNVVLMMTCAPGSSRIALSAMTTENAPTVGFDGAVSLIEASAPATAAPLKGFRRTGDLALIDGRRKVKIAAGAKDKPAVDRFFKACASV